MHVSEDGKASIGAKLAKGCGILFLVFFGLAFLGALVGDPSDENRPADSAQVAESASVAPTDNQSSGVSESSPPPVVSKWIYSEQKDELRNSAVYQARIRSENSHDFSFPYGSGNYLTMVVRKHPQWGRDVFFRIDNGQMMCDIYDCRYTISFDGAAESLTLVPPEDRDSTMLFAKYGDAIIRKLKNADRVIVELQFYQEGNRQFIFETAGLEWEH